MTKITIESNPSKKQWEALQLLFDNETTFLLFGGGRGGGKLTSLDTPILTPFGFIPMRRLKIGSKITNPDSSISEIIQLHPIQTVRKYTIYFHDGTSTNCGEDHLWLAWKGNDSRKIKNKEISGEKSAKVITTKKMKEWLDSALNNKNNKYPLIPVTNEVPFNKVCQWWKREIDSYLLGLLLGDGYLNEKTITLTNTEKEIIEYMTKNYQVSTYKSEQHCETTRFIGESRLKLIYQLKFLNLIGCHAHDKFIPEAYKYDSIENRYSLIQGLMDTDGYIDKRGQIYYTTVSKKLAEDIAFVLRSLGAVVTISSRIPTFTYKEERKEGRLAYELYIKHRHPDKLFRLKRKKDRTFGNQQDIMFKKVVKIDIGEPTEMRCLTVSHPNGLYMQDDFTVTHNSWLGWEWLLTLCLKYPGIKAFCARNQLKRLMNSTFPTFSKVMSHYKLSRDLWTLNSQYNFIQFYNGSRIDLLDVAYQPSDPLYERFGSTEYTVGWLEEIGEMREKVFDMLKSSVGRCMNDEYNIKPKIYLTCNPKKHWAYTQFYKPFKEGTLPTKYKFIQSLYKDNPYSAAGYKDMLLEIRDPVMRDRLMNGNWEYDDDEGALIQYERILDIFTNQYSPGPDDRQLTSSDVARFGRDKAVIALWDEWHIKALWYYNKSSTQFLQEKINKIHSQHHVPTYCGVVDDGGVGAGVTDYIPGINRFIAGGRPIESIDENPEDIDRYSFLNLRSQCYHTLSEAINKGLVSINLDGIHIPDDDKEKGITPYDVRNWIVEELECIRKKDYEKNEKKFQIISKEEMKGLIGRSPDFADCLSLRCIFNLGVNSITGGEDYEIDVEW